MTCDWTPVRLFELVSTEKLSKLSSPSLGNSNWWKVLQHREGSYLILWHCFVALTRGFMDLSGHSWVLLALVKPVSSSFIMQRNNGESGDHVAAVMISPKENKTDVFLTMLAIANNRAANLIPIFLTPKTVSMALGKCKARFPGSILPPHSTSEEEADRINTPWCYLTTWHQRCPCSFRCGSSAHRRLCTPMFSYLL